MKKSNNKESSNEKRGKKCMGKIVDFSRTFLPVGKKNISS